ncbi:MAG: BON domain-containing protein [Ginsengibacter sp.]
MANNRNNRNHFDKRRSNIDWNDNSEWNQYSDKNSNFHQRSWNESGNMHEDNYGLGDTSQGSANYGNTDHGRGARYYGTGSYGGYSGSDREEGDFGQRGRDRRGMEGMNNYNQRNRHLDRGDSNYGRGSRYGNSGSYFGRSEPGYRRDYGPKNPNESGGRSNSNRNERSGGNWDGDRDWWDRTSDEVASWFGDEDAERRRELDKRYGPHSGKGPKGYARSDEKLKDEIEEKLYHDSFVDATDIEVSVSDGEVTLSGTVDNRQTKRRAEDLAEDISGVKDVSNHLTINRSADLGNIRSTSMGNNYSENSEISGPTKTGLSSEEEKLDQSNDLYRTKNK